MRSCFVTAAERDESLLQRHTEQSGLFVANADQREGNIHTAHAEHHEPAAGSQHQLFEKQHARVHYTGAGGQT